MSADSPLYPSVPTRKRSSLSKFFLWIGAIFVGLLVAKFFVGVGRSLYHFTHFSHFRVYQNETLEVVKNRAVVVRPLIDEEQSFGIAVSIWLLPIEEHGTQGVGDVAETPLFSDIVFHSLRLSDKHKDAIVKFRLPVSPFRRLSLEENDIRASFVIVPTSPSLLDYANNFSTWRPESMKIPPVRSWPFPLGASDKGPPSLADRALDSFGISIPLLEFHETQSKCPASHNAGEPSQRPDSDSIASDEQDDDEDDDAILPGISNIAKYPEHALKRHPFLLTRTQIRAVDEVHIFNRKAYNKEHLQLKSSSCGQSAHTTPDNNLCQRSYITNGNWETRVELQIPDNKTGEPRTEWAYAPYIGHGAFSSGPKDLVPLPVTREKCIGSQETTHDPEFIDIDWHLSYSGRTPGKFVVTELIPKSHRVGHLESEYKKAKVHDKAELWNGLYGHRFYEDAHPRRRFFIGTLVSIFIFILVVLDMGYWYTRTSTVFISKSGTVLIALGGIVSAYAHLASTAQAKKMDSWQWLWLISFTLLTKLALPLFMLNAVTRLEFSRNNSSWLSSVRKVNPTHKERNSDRLDSKTGWGIKAAVCISLVIVYYLFSPDNYLVISSRLPDPTPDDHHANIFSRIHGLVFFPLTFTGRLAQLLLNHRSQTFAGSYKLAVAIRFLLLLLTLIIYSPTVVGRFDARPGLSAPQAVEMLALAGMIWQAATLPSVIQTRDDEDNE
ncbi:hypothetical protein B0H10DRAFT_1977759 [Mycena sp. CBHHK59/15]|nr:hypothetical protein B0H10DRAFT_1977759 [Mycena sp. CBHHK59/15]